ncbi:MAG: ATP-binding cassette domain-containing protein, partial [Spirochaetia bacterium]
MLEIRKLHKKIAGHVILDSVDLTLKEGETLTVVGISGCGKTTLLKLLMGLLTADAGSITIEGEEITSYSEEDFNTHVRNRMTMVFQYGALWDSKTVEQNIDLALNLRKGLSIDMRKKLVKESLERVGLEGTEHMYPEELSGGMTKRAAIARAIAAQPKYLLYDEPTTGL